MIARLVIFVVSVIFTGCYEGIEHQPPVDAGLLCTSNEECPCGERCEQSDAGRVCTLYRPTTCVGAHDCSSAPHLCAQTQRRGHGCGYLECQP